MDKAALRRMRLQGRSVAVSLVLAFAFFLALGLNSCMNGEPGCTTPTGKPVWIALNPDSLTLVPYSQSSHYFNESGGSAGYSRYFSLTLSPSDGRSALSYFDSSGLSLYADSTRITTPPLWLEGGGWGQCGVYRGLDKIDLVDPGKADTSFTLQVRKSGVAVRSWKVEYKFDSTDLPTLRVAPSPGGFAATISLKPGAEIQGVWFGGDVTSAKLAFERTGDSLRAEVIFKDTEFLRYPIDSASLNLASYSICAYAGSGYESAMVDGVPFPATSDFCWVLDEEIRFRITEYRKHFCTDCR